MNKTQIFDLWNKLPFDYFGDEQKKAQWCDYALEISSNLELNNVGLIADTGTGKTIMSFLVVKALKLRTLFLAPTVILTEQHADLYKTISGETASVLHGKMKKRDWKKGDLVVATPHIFMADFEKGLVSENDFDLLIIDEMHKAQGLYPYVPVAGIFNSKDKRILAVSASPGASQEDIAWMEKVFKIKHWVTAEIEKQVTKNRLVKVGLSPELEKANVFLKKFYLETLKSLVKVFEDNDRKVIIPINEENPFLTQEETDDLSKLVHSLPRPTHHEDKLNFYDASSLFSKQQKLSYLFKILMTENYNSFFEYVQTRLVNNTSKASKAIINNNDFRSMYSELKNNPKVHPKEKALDDLMREMDWKNQSCLVFVSTRALAFNLAELFKQKGFLTGVLVGGREKSPKENAKTIENFSRREIQVIFATSVVEEGLSLPDVDVVIHYNQPMTEVARLQRGGRTGRFREGLVIFLISDIPYENNMYFATLAKLKKMKSMFYESARREVVKNKSEKKKKQMELTGQLAISWPTEESEFPF